MRRYFILAVGLFAMMGPVHAAEQGAPVLLELFTSQGCSSCPPADALLKKLSAENPTFIPLSFHVHYWDYLGWKDPYSSSENTLRQKTYAQTIGNGQMYTPELVVNGRASVVGSNEIDVRTAITLSRNTPLAVDVTIEPDTTSGNLIVTVSSRNHPIVNGTFNVMEFDFDHNAHTEVKAGENSGRMLENLNNVTVIKKLGNWTNGETRYTIPFADLKGDGFAVTVQSPDQRDFLGAALYRKP